MSLLSFFQNQDRATKLKAEARKHYIAHGNIADRYGCGITLASHINPDLSRHAEAFNKAMDELAEIDPDCPKGRL